MNGATDARPVRRTDTVRYVDHVMGMPISLAMRGRHAHDAYGRRAWAGVMTALRAADRVFSTYRPDSYVSRLGRGEIGLEDCPLEVAEVFALGDLAEQDSHGAFRVRRIHIDGETTVDPSGVVKGWAVEQAARHLRRLDGTDFCLSAGGDMVCRTLDADDGPWRIGVEHPLDTTRLVAMVPVRTGAVATSGATRRGRHIVDARTGRPPEGVASVTVVGSSLTWADIDATAAYAQVSNAARWLRTRPGRRGLVVWEDGSTTLVDSSIRGRPGAETDRLPTAGDRTDR